MAFYEPKAGLTYVDDVRLALTLTFIRDETVQEVLDRFNEVVSWDGEYTLKVQSLDGGVYRLYLNRKVQEKS